MMYIKVAMDRLFKDLEVCKNYVHKDRVKILSAIDLLFNKKSELNKIQNIEERTKEACRQAGLKSTEILDDDQVKDLIFHYLSYFQNSNEYQLLINDQQLFWHLQREMMKPVPTDKDEIEDYYDFKLKISKQSADLLVRITLRFNNLYNAEEIGKPIVEMIEEKMRVLRPEDRVTKQSP